MQQEQKKKLFDKNRGIRSYYSEEKILTLIRESNFKDRKDVDFINRIKTIENYREEMKTEILNKTKELNIPTNRREEIYYRPLSLITFDSLDGYNY